MIYYGIATHNDLVSKEEGSTEPDKFVVLVDLVESLDMFTHCDYALVIRDNESLDYRFCNFNVTLKTKFPHINSQFIPSSVNSLTDAWNELLRIALKDPECEAVVIFNQDIVVTKNWELFLRAIEVQSRDLLAPMSSASVYQKQQDCKEEHYVPEDALIQVASVQGFCYGGSRRCFEMNMYDSENFFDPHIEWEYNDEEWQQRNNNSGGRSLIVKNTYIIHLDQQSWGSAGLRSSKHPFGIYSHEFRQKVTRRIPYGEYINGLHNI
jgi:hypothetical protein